MILDVSAGDIERLNDTDLRELVGLLCEREVKASGYSTSAVTWGGHQNSADGGVDVRVALPVGSSISGYVPRAATCFQVKAQDMPRAAILEEMAPDGIVLPAIEELADQGGAYVIVSSKGSLADTSLTNRKAAMRRAIAELPTASALVTEFFDRRRIASWVNQHAGLVPWIRKKIGVQLSGWRPFEDWSSTPAAVDSLYLVDAQVRLVGPSIGSTDGLNAEQAIARLRKSLVRPKGVVRLAGLSGVGKTRLIQALFDDRIGTDALQKSDALYTDISDSPDPAPQEMLSQLISNGDRVVLIVDNCPHELHAKLAARVATAKCVLSVITVEYDINDDEPQHTDVFKLEPASPDLIDKIIAHRYPAISPPSRHVISEFSEGNSRVAMALAATAEHGESLASLKDTELFERLFYQQKDRSPELLDAAKACALLYSFDGETVEGSESELTSLATLAEQTVGQLHKHVAELRRRQLIQQRGIWRAILPHAVANWLAKRALEDIPRQRIEEVIVEGPSGRMLKSFSRRLGYLHDDGRATALAAKWMSPDGKLGSLGKLNSLGEEVFENAAPVDPEATLGFIEKTANANTDWFFGDQNENRDQIVRVIRAIAYDPALFERGTSVLIRFVVNETGRERRSARDSLGSLFWISLSGTHATVEQRVAVVRNLLESESTTEQELGLKLLGELLKAGMFSASHSFEFGAWKRDYGLYPKTGDDVRHWFATVIDMTQSVESSAKDDPARVRHVMATHFRELMGVGMFDELIGLATAFAHRGGWPEGWVGVRGSLRRHENQNGEAFYSKLVELEALLRPTTLAAKIRAYALTPEYGALDIVDDDDEVQSSAEAREKINDLCRELGRELAENSAILDSILAEIIASSASKPFMLGRGIAEACESLAAWWERLCQGFLGVPNNRRHGWLMSGFLCSAVDRSPEDAEVLFDNVLANVGLHPFFVPWQACAVVNTRAFGRFMAAVRLDSVPVGTFNYLATVRTHEGLSDDQFHALIVRIMDREGGGEVAAEIVGMRFFGTRGDKGSISEGLRATGRYLLSKVEFVRADRLDHMLAEVIEDSYNKPEHEQEARELCARIISVLMAARVYGWDLGDIVTALVKVFPVVVLDMLVEEAIEEGADGADVFRSIRDNRAGPLDDMPDEIWTSWAAQKPSARHELLARVMRFSTAGDEEHSKGWSPAALKLIGVAPDPVRILSIFYQRFRPGGWSGSLATTLASRLPLIEHLLGHNDARIAAWASENVTEFAVEIERERKREELESRGREQRFE